MAVSYPPSVFISSTCYDMSQHREDLKDFVESLGLVPILSELSSFPVDPNIDAINNCMAAVKEKADIFVLLVGNRYGSQTESGKSITNLEYLEARSKGIPRYVFINKEIIARLPLWERNQKIDTSGVVDSPRLFEFVKKIKDQKEDWIHPFESIRDVKDALRIQLAYLFKNALDIRAKFVAADIPEELRELSGPALSLVLNKPIAWEYRLFSCVLANELKKYSPLKKDIEHGFSLGPRGYVSGASQTVKWQKTKTIELGNFASSAKKVINAVLRKAVERPVGSADPGEIIYAAQRLGSIYRRALEWISEITQMQVDDEFGPSTRMLSRLPINMLGEIEQFSREVEEKTRLAVSEYERTGIDQTIEVRVSFTMPDLSELMEENRRLAERFSTQE